MFRTYVTGSMPTVGTLSGRKLRGLMLAGLLMAASGSALAQIPGVEELEDPATGAVCNLVNAVDAHLVVLEPTGSLPRQFALVTGEDVELADSFIDDDFNVFFFNEPFGAIRFDEDGDGATTLWWVDAVGNVLSLDPLTLVPATTNARPEDFVDTPCDACLFWDNTVDCPLEPDVTTIITQPVGGVVCEGDRVSLFVEAIGSRIVGFQWFKNGNLLIGATGSTLNLGSVDANDTASYFVEVIDDDDFVTESNRVTLTVEFCDGSGGGGQIILCGPQAFSMVGLTLLGLTGLRRRRRML